MTRDEYEKLPPKGALTASQLLHQAFWLGERIDRQTRSEPFGQNGSGATI
jgi:hypothetical protein